jgi:glycosyltransferase involved in cell wall biosynthesis
MPTLSVLMSVYNGDRFLKAAMDSILNQTFRDFEFLIIDDGSTDQSAQILQAYADQDSRVRVIRQANQGLTQSLNRLIHEAQGEFLARMDGDDVAMPERFARQVAFLRQHPQVVCVGTGQQWIDEDDVPLMEWSPTADPQELQALLLSGQTHICHPSAMMRRAAVRAVGGYDTQFRAAQDLDLWLRLGEVGDLSNLPDILLAYRVHTHSVSERRVKQQTECVKLACQLAWQRRGIEGQYDLNESWRHRFILRCGWQMFNRGCRQKAIAYGMRAIKAIPLNLEGWRLLACALVKPLPQPDPAASSRTP